MDYLRFDPALSVDNVVPCEPPPALINPLEPSAASVAFDMARTSWLGAVARDGDRAADHAAEIDQFLGSADLLDRDMFRRSP